MRVRKILPLAVLCLAALAVIIVPVAMKSLGGFALWNMSPPIIGVILIQPWAMFDTPVTGRISTCYPHLVGVAVIAAVTILFQMAWLFDWGGTATGSSTSALAFIFVPIWATVIGLGAGLATLIVQRLMRN